MSNSASRCCSNFNWSATTCKIKTGFNPLSYVKQYQNSSQSKQEKPKNQSETTEAKDWRLIDKDWLLEKMTCINLTGSDPILPALIHSLLRGIRFVKRDGNKAWSQVKGNTLVKKIQNRIVIRESQLKLETKVNYRVAARVRVNCYETKSWSS